MNRRFGEMHDDFTVLDHKVDRHFEFIVDKSDRQFQRLVGIQIAALLAVLGALISSYYR